MPQSAEQTSPVKNSRQLRSFVLVTCAVAGLVASFAAFFLLQPFQTNVVTYKVERAAGAPYTPALILGLLLLSLPPVLAIFACIQARSLDSMARCAAPLLVAAPLALAAWFQESPPIWAVYLFILGVSWASGQAAAGVSFSKARRIPDVLCVVLILAFLVAIAIAHVRAQRSFFEHFMLGHADIGHFTEHLKNVIAGRGLRADSFPNPHFGVHFTPLMYLLAPGYFLWPSVTYLMAVGPVLLHLPALIVYWASRRAGAETAVSLLLAMAWLMLPSLGRLVYCNTYGFQWTYFSLPLVAMSIAAMVQQKWALYWIFSIAVLLCQETFAAIVFGTGIYILLFTKNRWTGGLSCAVAMGYLFLCTQVIIPYFAVAGRFERMDLFGSFGKTMPELLTFMVRQPLEVLQRLARGESIHLLAILLSSVALTPLLRLRLLIAAVPTLGFLLLLQNPDWLSIKFWHHAPILPILFAGAMYTCAPKLGTDDSSIEARTRRESYSHRLGLSVAILTGAAWGTYFFGFSPISKAYGMYVQDPILAQPDPRFAFVTGLRREMDRRAWVLATERMAAHFTDFERIYTGNVSHSVDLVIIDRSDTWDPTGLPERAHEFAADPDYRVRAEFGPVIVFEGVKARHWARP